MMTMVMDVMGVMIFRRGTTSHCYSKYVSKLQNVTDGMEIECEIDKSSLNCEVCIKNTFEETESLM